MYKSLFLILVFTSGCWLVPPPRYTHRNAVVVDQAKVGQWVVGAVIDKTLNQLGGNANDLSGFEIVVVNVPICQPIDNGFILADGITYKTSEKNVIMVSTVRGCFDSLVHEVAHVIQNRQGKPDPKHKDIDYWARVEKLESWVIGKYCGTGKQDMTPEKAIELCK